MVMIYSIGEHVSPDCSQIRPDWQASIALAICVIDPSIINPGYRIMPLISSDMRNGNLYEYSCSEYVFHMTQIIVFVCTGSKVANICTHSPV